MGYGTAIGRDRLSAKGTHKVSDNAPMSGYGKPQIQITGDWSPADGTDHHIEVAPATLDGREVFAMRTNFLPEAVIPVTRTQVKSLPTAFGPNGTLSHLISL